MSKWGDTVMSWERIRIILHEQDKVRQRDNMFCLEAIAKAQAELTGPIAFKAGIREVVEWMKENCKESDLVDSWDSTYTVECRNSYNLRAFRAKLKEWGI